MLTPAILGTLRVPVTAAPAAQTLLNALSGQAVEAVLQSLQPDGLTLRLPDGRQLQAQGSLPFPPGTVLALKAQPLPGGAGVRLQVLRATPPPTSPLLGPLVQGEAAALLARLQGAASTSPLAALLRTLAQPGSAAPEGPETWSTWLRGALESLADPGAAPAGSAFHRLQAQEGTGWFEVPLPWAPGDSPVRLWVEADDEGRGAGAERVHRLLLSVPFSSLGEVKVGLEQRAAGLRVKVWLRDPGQVAPHLDAMAAELGALGRPVDLQTLPLPTPCPDLAALVGGQPLQALG